MKRLPVFILLCVCLTAAAQNYPAKKLSFEAITIDDGLSQGMVNAILQDHLGFMWFATKDGLNRYDGYNFVVYRRDLTNKNSISDNYTTCLFEDSKKRLWIGTAIHGVELFNRETNTFTHFNNDPKNKNSLYDNLVISITEDKEGVLYTMGTRGVSVVHETKTAAGKDSFSFKNIDSCYSPRLIAPLKNQVWILPTYHRITALTKQKDGSFTKQLLPFEKYHFEKNPGSWVNSYICDTVNNVIYLIMSDGITKYDVHKNSFENISGSGFKVSLANNSVLDNANNFWIPAYKQLLYFDTKQKATYTVTSENGLYDNMLADPNYVYKDRSGNIWIGTKGYGLLKFNTQAEKFHHTDNISVTGIFPSKANKVIIVSDTKGGFIFNKDKPAYEGQVPDSSMIKKHLVKDIFINAAVTHDDSNYLIAKGALLLNFNTYTKNAGIVNLGGNFAFPLYVAKDSLVWMGIERSFTAYNTKTKKTVTYPYPINTNHAPYKFIQAIHQQNDSIFWLGTITGLYRLNKNVNAWQLFANKPEDSTSLSFNLIFSLYPDPVEPAKYLWIGTNGGGFNRMDYATNHFIHYSSKDGLPNDVVYGILSDAENNLWLSTNKGLSCFNPATKQFQNYETKDGLQSNEFNRNAFCKTPDGTLYFGGINGFNYFNPYDLGKNTIPPGVVITGFKIGYKEVRPTDDKKILLKPIELTRKIELDYTDNMISFEFAAMDFTQPAKNIYQYKMDGFDKDWIYSGNTHTATYTNLDPGTYTFYVKAANSNGVWNETPVSIELIILPPWYMTWWFRTLIAVIIIAGAYAFYRYRLQQALQLQAVRNRIASDLHDEIGSNLSNISIFSNVAQQKSSGENEMLLKKISDYTQTSMEAMSDIVWMINARNDRFENIFMRMRSLAAEIFEAKNCALHIEFDDRLNNIKLNMENRKNFYLIYKEAINNIAKYAACKDVWIGMKLNHNHVLMHIKDNGVGFDIAHVKKGNGLFNMQKRAEMLHGKLSLVSNIKEGTSLQLSFEV